MFLNTTEFTKWVMNNPCKPCAERIDYINKQARENAANFSTNNYQDIPHTLQNLVAEIEKMPGTKRRKIIINYILLFDEIQCGVKYNAKLKQGLAENAKEELHKMRELFIGILNKKTNIEKSKKKMHCKETTLITLLNEDGKKHIALFENLYKDSYSQMMVVALFAMYNLNYININPAAINKASLWRTLNKTFKNIGTLSAFNTNMRIFKNNNEKNFDRFFFNKPPGKKNRKSNIIKH